MTDWSEKLAPAATDWQEKVNPVPPVVIPDNPDDDPDLPPPVDPPPPPPPPIFPPPADPMNLPFTNNFGLITDPPVILESQGDFNKSASPLFVVTSGGYMTTKDGRGWTPQGDMVVGSKWQKAYNITPNNKRDTDNGLHPQNIFRMYDRAVYQDVAASLKYLIVKDNLSASSYRAASNGLFLFMRATQDGLNGIYGGVRNDGTCLFKRKNNGIYTPALGLANLPGISGTYNRDTNPNLLPHSVWIGLKMSVKNVGGNVELKLYWDPTWTGTWTQIASYTDSSSQKILTAGHIAIRTDFMDVGFDQYRLEAV